MASSTLFKTLPKFGHFHGAITTRLATSKPTLILPSNPKFIHTSQPEDGSEAKDAIKTRANVEMIMPGENIMNHKAYSTAQHVREKADEVSTKAKEAMGSAKETAQRAKDTLVDTAKDSSKQMPSALRRA